MELTRAHEMQLVKAEAGTIGRVDLRDLARSMAVAQTGYWRNFTCRSVTFNESADGGVSQLTPLNDRLEESLRLRDDVADYVIAVRGKAKENLPQSTGASTTATAPAVRELFGNDQTQLNFFEAGSPKLEDLLLAEGMLSLGPQGVLVDKDKDKGKDRPESRGGGGGGAVITSVATTSASSDDLAVAMEEYQLWLTIDPLVRLLHELNPSKEHRNPVTHPVSGLGALRAAPTLAPGNSLSHRGPKFPQPQRTCWPPNFGPKFVNLKRAALAPLAGRATGLPFLAGPGKHPIKTGELPPQAITQLFGAQKTAGVLVPKTPNPNL
eukprot:FR738807.1.p1 GENE.FR738807.1~~FR738807.1.p1  ORF type:complete len:372 (+),score=68.86 FR738807.1:149-1117(+)